MQLVELQITMLTLKIALSITWTSSTIPIEFENDTKKKNPKLLIQQKE